MDTLDKIRRIVATLRERVENDNTNPTWGYASVSDEDVAAISNGESLYECTFSSTNTAVIGPRSIAVLKYGNREFVYAGEDVVNLYWLVKSKLEGTTNIDSFANDLNALP